MPTYKTISSADIKTTRSNLNQLIDFVEQDMSGSDSTRKSYEVFVTGTTRDQGVTSSLFQTVFDQNHTMQVANELFDLTVGLFYNSSTVIASASSGDGLTTKLEFPSSSLMMREKVNIYRQYAQLLLGDATRQFTAPVGSSTATDNIDEALFINFKRLFVRDGIKRETFAMRFFESGSSTKESTDGNGDHGKSNIDHNNPSGSVIFTDVGSATTVELSQTGGHVGNLKKASDASKTVGLLYYQHGIAVLDIKKILSGTQKMSGSIAGVGNTSSLVKIGDPSGNEQAKFIPDFLVSGSIDDIVDHFASVRFGSGSQTFMTFQNNTQINSTLVFCRATADEFNYSSNPTYTDSNGRIKVINDGEEGVQKGFSFVTTVGLYDASEQLIAVAKLSRPVEKNDQKDLTFRVRLDF